MPWGHGPSPGALVNAFQGLTSGVMPTLHSNSSPWLQEQEPGLPFHQSPSPCAQHTKILKSVPFSLHLACTHSNLAPLTSSGLPSLPAPTHPAPSFSLIIQVDISLWTSLCQRVAAVGHLLQIHLIILAQNINSWASPRSAKSASLMPRPRIPHI